MLHSIKVIASIAATGIALVAYIPYLIDMFRGKNKPHLYTWISIFLITAIVAYLQLIGKAGVGSIPMMTGLAVDAIILFYCFRFGTKDIVFVDKVCLAITIIGIVFYLTLRGHPAISLAIVTAAEIISFFPTVRKTRNDPYSESLPSYYLLMLKLTLILIAVEHYNFLTASYPILWGIIFIIFLSLVYRWRSQTKKRRQPRELEEAPLI